MLLIFFSLLSLCFHTHWFVSLWGTCFTWLHPLQVAFQFNQEPRLSQICFVSPNHAQIQNTIVTERFRHHPQNIGAGYAFLSFIPSLELQCEKPSHHRPSTTPWAGEFFDRIAFFAVYPQQSVTQLGWATVLISRQPMIHSKTET